MSAQVRLTTLQTDYQTSGVDIASARENVDFFSKEYERQSKLMQTGFTTKARLQEAEHALAEARSEAQSIVAKSKADMQVELDAAIAKADVKIAAKTAVSEKAIAEIRAGALDSVSLVATETATAVVAAIGGSADAEAISAAVAEQMKG